MSHTIKAVLTDQHGKKEEVSRLEFSGGDHPLATYLYASLGAQHHNRLSSGDGGERTYTEVDILAAIDRLYRIQLIGWPLFAKNGKSLVDDVVSLAFTAWENVEVAVGEDMSEEEAYLAVRNFYKGILVMLFSDETLTIDFR